jgi:hypothetical protein
MADVIFTEMHASTSYAHLGSGHEQQQQQKQRGVNLGGLAIEFRKSI